MSTKDPTKFYVNQYARHLQSALELDKIKFYYMNPTYRKKRYPLLDDQAFRLTLTGFVGHTCVLPWLERSIRDSQSVSLEATSALYDKVLQTTYESLFLQSACMAKDFPSRMSPYLHEMVETLSNHPDLFLSYVDKVSVQVIHDQLELECLKGEKLIRLPCLPDMVFFDNLVLLERFPGGPLVVTYEMFLSVSDKMEARFSLYLYSCLVDSSSVLRPMNHFTLTSTIYELLDSAYHQFGNEAIRVFKMLEPLCNGLVLLELDGATHDHNYLPAVLQEFYAEYPQLRPMVEGIRIVLQDFLTLHGEAGIPYVIEQYGQEKLHFNTLVDQEAGLIKMHKYGTEFRSINPNAYNRLRGLFNREYVSAYFEKEGSLPPIYPSVMHSDKIRHILQSGVCPSKRECKKIALQEWAWVNFAQHKLFNYFPEALDLVDDKAITPHLDHIYQLFAYDALHVLGKFQPRDKENTRLVLEILHREQIDIREFYSTVTQMGMIPPNWAAIQLKAKERELKIAARDFSILTFECRMMTSTCERNISDSILTYFPQQTMTMSGNSLRYRIEDLITLPTTDDFVWVKFVIDLVQWNFTFRNRIVSAVTAILNTIFGVDHFSVPMRVFAESLLFSASKFTPPGTPHEFHLWTEHLGGNQGLCQKLWTIITILIITEACDMLGLEHHITGAGDNQVVAVKLKNDSMLEQECEKVKEALALNFSQYGLEVKKEETYYGVDWVGYQRKYYHKGIQCSNGLKYTLRACAGETDLNGGVHMLIATAMNGGISINENTVDPLIGPLCAYIEGFTMLLSKPSWKNLLPPLSTDLVLLPLIPAELGGLPFLPLSSFLYSGHKDLVSESLASLSWIWTHRPLYRPQITNLMDMEYSDVTVETQLQLILDPHSINIRKPITAESILKRKVEKYLRGDTIIRNQQLRQIFELLDPQVQVELGQLLLEFRPLHVGLLHSLFEYSLIGATASIVNKFTRVSSIVKMTNANQIKDDIPSFLAQIRNSDQQNLRKLRTRLQSSPALYLTFIHCVTRQNHNNFQEFCELHTLTPTCTFALRLFLVSMSYGLFPELVLGPFTPSPIEQIAYYPEYPDHYHGFVEVLTPQYNIPNSRNLMETVRGPYKPDLGSTTSNPVKTLKLTNLSTMHKGQGIVVMLHALAWMSNNRATEGARQVIRNLIIQRAPELAGILDRFILGTTGSCMEHRFDTPGSVMGCSVNCPTVISTHYQLSSNQAVQIQRGETDRFIFFQDIHQHIYSVCRLVDPFKLRVFCVILPNCCSFPIPESQFHFPMDRDLPGLRGLSPQVLTSTDTAHIVEEVDFQHALLSKAVTGRIPAEVAICGYIGHLLYQSIRAYSRGITLRDEERGGPGAPQTIINLSLVRAVPLSMLLAHCGLAISRSGYLGSFTSPRATSTSLKLLSHTSRIPSDVAPFTPLLEALVTTGRMAEIPEFSLVPIKWVEGVQLHGFLPALFSAMGHCLSEYTTRDFPLVLIEEMKHSNHSFKPVLTFSRRWSHIFRSFSRKNPSYDDLDLVDRFNRISTTYHIVIVPDSGLVVENARPRLKLETPSHNLLLCQQQQPGPVLIGPGFPSGPWLLHTSARKVRPILHQSAVSLATSLDEMPYQPLSLLRKISRASAPHSGARLKLLEIMTTLTIMPPTDSQFLCLAEGSGSYASALAHMFPTANVIYNSLVDPSLLPIAMASQYIPPDLLCPCNLQSRVLITPNLSATKGDLCQNTTWVELETVLGLFPTPLGLLTWDMEGFGVNREEAFENLACHLPTLAPWGLIIKFFGQDLITSIHDHLQTILNLFKEVVFIKPPSSNALSSEIFVYASKWNPNGNNNHLIPVRFLLEGLVFLRHRSQVKAIIDKTVDQLLWDASVPWCMTTYPDRLSPPGVFSSQLESMLWTHAALLTTLAPTLMLGSHLLPRAFQHAIKSNTAASKYYNSDMVTTGWVVRFVLQRLLPIPDQDKVIGDLITLKAKGGDLLDFSERLLSSGMLPEEINLSLRKLGWVMTDLSSVKIWKIKWLLTLIEWLVRRVPHQSSETALVTPINLAWYSELQFDDSIAALKWEFPLLDPELCLPILELAEFARHSSKKKGFSLTHVHTLWNVVAQLHQINKEAEGSSEVVIYLVPMSSCSAKFTAPKGLGWLITWTKGGVVPDLPKLTAVKHVGCMVDSVLSRVWLYKLR